MTEAASKFENLDETENVNKITNPKEEIVSKLEAKDIETEKELPVHLHKEKESKAA